VDKWFDENHIAPDVRNKVFDRMHHCINPQDGKIFWRHNDGVTGGMTLPEDTIYCLDAADGKIVWKHVGKRGYFRGAGDGPGSCTPCVADGRVYVLHVDGLVYCLNAKDGAEIWTAYVLPKLDLPRGKYGISFGGHGSIVVLDGLAIVQAGMQGPLMAFDAATGALAWTRREAKGWHSTPTPWVKDGRIYLICNNRDGREVYCADIHAEGKVLWTTRVDFGCFSSPAVSGDSLVFYSGKTLYCYRMSLDKVEPLWNVRIRQCDAEPSASPLIYKNRVYVAGLGLTLCVNLEDGKVLWEGKTSSDDQSSVLLADDKLIIQCWGDLSLLNAAPDKFELLAKVKMPGQCQWASPAIANGRMYLRFNNGVRCFDVSQSAPAATPGATPAK
jgi:outer membrane protein assembly factor BamB